MHRPSATKDLGKREGEGGERGRGGEGFLPPPSLGERGKRREWGGRTPPIGIIRRPMEEGTLMDEAHHTNLPSIPP